VVLVKGSSLLTGQSAWSRVSLDADVEFPRIPLGSVEEGDGGPSERFVSLDRVFCTISVLSKPCRFRIGSIVVLTAGSLQCSRRGVPVYQSASLNPVEAPVY
jgi:hypothetical protein